MKIPVPAVAVTPLFAVVAISVLVAAYLVFLYKLWVSYQDDRHRRASAIDSILDTLPKRTVEGTAE